MNIIQDIFDQFRFRIASKVQNIRRAIRTEKVLLNLYIEIQTYIYKLIFIWRQYGIL